VDGGKNLVEADETKTPDDSKKGPRKAKGGKKKVLSYPLRRGQGPGGKWGTSLEQGGLATGVGGSTGNSPEEGSRRSIILRGKATTEEIRAKRFGEKVEKTTPKREL